MQHGQKANALLNLKIKNRKNILDNLICVAIRPFGKLFETMVEKLNPKHKNRTESQWSELYMYIALWVKAAEI